MGKRIISQARGRGGPRYRAPSFRYKGAAKHMPYATETKSAIVVDFMKCAGHSAPLARIKFENNDEMLCIAPEGIRVGDMFKTGLDVEFKSGNSLPLLNIPEGTAVYNIEHVPGDGGKFIRSSGAFGRVMSKTKEGVVVLLPSKKKKVFNNACRATIGIIAGGGRLDKPLLKAGNAMFKARAKNKLYPRSSAASMNATDHPMGNSRSSRKSKGKPAPRNAPPGRKVGMVRPKRSGRRTGKR